MNGTAARRDARGLKHREARRPVNICARMRTERGWCDIAIRNVSSGGFMAHSPMPPRRGHYIEIWRGEACIVGYVVWSSGSRFGVRSQQAIDISGLVAKRPAAVPGTERRRTQRQPDPPSISPQAQADRARQIGRAFEFVALGAAVTFAALFLTSIVSEVLHRPFSIIGEHLASHQ